jgi:hypothetical protein
MKVYFSDFFDIAPELIEKYGAFNISLLNDLPLFIDPFLLFNSKKSEYQNLHKEIINYVLFLKNLSGQTIEDALIKSLFTFSEVKQNWFGYSLTGNKGSGLGEKFAFALRNNLVRIFLNFGNETISQGSHLEKLCLINNGVGRDNISDFVTNLIKHFLLEYTQYFATKNINKIYLKKFHVPKVSFNYHTKTWVSEFYVLPNFNNDFILLTPKDILTKDDAWINRQDILKHLNDIIGSIPNEQLRAHINQYFISLLPNNPQKDITKDDKQRALTELIKNIPDFLDYYIRYKEAKGHKAVSISQEKVKDTEIVFIEQLKIFTDSLNLFGFYKIEGSSYDEAMKRVQYLKQVIENNDGYRVFYLKGKPIKREQDLQIMFKLTWNATTFDINAEVNNGRGPVDFKISKGSYDKTLVEFKLANNTKLKNNLAKQVGIYKAANQSNDSIKVILFFSYSELTKLQKILKELHLENNKNIILIDARDDNKQSASNVKI